MNKISLSTWLYDRLSVEDAIKHVKKCGYENIELSGWNWVDGIWTVEEVARVCEKEKVSVLSVHCNHHSLHDKDYWSEEHYEEYHDGLYKSLKIFGSPIIVEHGLYADSIYAGQQRKYVDICIRLAEKYGIPLTFENVPSTTLCSPESLKSVLGGPVAFTFDVAHSVYANYHPLDFKSLYGYMINAHMYDVVAGVELSDWAPVDTGLGKINWPEYIGELKKINYSGLCTVELTEDNLRKVLQVYEKITSHHVVDNIADYCAIYSRERLEKLL